MAVRQVLVDEALRPGSEGLQLLRAQRVPERRQSYLCVVGRLTVFEASDDVHPAVGVVLQPLARAWHYLIEHGHGDEDVGEPSPDRHFEMRERRCRRSGMGGR